MNDKQQELIKAAIAALSQKATYQTDVDYALRCLRDAIQEAPTQPPPPPPD